MKEVYLLFMDVPKDLEEEQHKTDDFIATICRNEKVSIEELEAGSRRKEVSEARSRIAIGLVTTHGVAIAEAARRVGASTSSVSKTVRRRS